ncbi:MAG: hypothetical protein J6L71_04575 [Clostridia bacterium]|nr:hypothetical protein [Clostridia bacterium]
MKKNKIVIISVILAIVTALGITVAAAYDSSEDPLVSLSYLLDVFEPELFDKFETRFNELEDFLVDTIEDKLSNPDNSASSGENSSGGDSSSALFEVIELTTGDQLYAVSACEIMLRAGQASCIAPDPTQGIADYTGPEVYDGQPLILNHMCIIPRGDGRGIVAESESVFIMVRGDYTIVKN